MSTHVEIGKSVWNFLTSTYFQVMAQYLVHSALANAIFWIKLGFLCLAGFICFVFPLCWPLLFYWAYKKYQTYQESRTKLLPSWTGSGTLEQKVLKAIEKNEPPKNGNFTSRDGLRLQWYSEGSGPKQILICNGVNCSYLLWKPLLDSLSDSFGKDWREQLTVVTWDYRGLYKSDAVCGWSTGV